jgi:diguanylate cyclase (GGDEF)-like protein
MRRGGTVDIGSRVAATSDTDPANTWSLRAAGGHDLLFARFALTFAVVTLLLLASEFVVSPAGELPVVLGLTTVGGLAVVVGTVLLSRGALDYVLVVAGGLLMLLGIAAGALAPDGLDAAALMPLAGAVLTLPRQHGRPLAAIFVLAFAAGMAGEYAAYTYGGASDTTSRITTVQSLLESGVMLGFTYSLVWWIGDRWWAANARVQHAMGSQRRLLEINERLLTTLDPEGVLSLIADSLKPVLAYDNLTIYRVERTAGVVVPVVARDRFAQLILGNTFPIDMGVTGWVVKHGEAQCVNDIHKDQRAATIPGTPDEPESLIVVPLLVRGEVAGTLNVGRMGEEEAHFTPEEFELARLFAGQASIALANAEVHRAVSNKAETDSLTGLRNRGSFDERLTALTQDLRAQPCSLVMVDLDGFKDYNDRHGHPAGDVALRAVGRAIGSAVRAWDLSFRYGGDEFAVVLPATDLDAAVQIAERVRDCIAKSAPPESGAITASAGVACDPGHSATRDSLVAAADLALYRAKSRGGDRVEAYDGAWADETASGAAAETSLPG